MSDIKRVVLDVLKPHHPGIVELSQRLSVLQGISGVNMAVAETGSLVLCTNEGNGRMVTTVPKVHIAIDTEGR